MRVVQLPSDRLVALTFGWKRRLLPWIPLSSIFIFSLSFPFLPLSRSLSSSRLPRPLVCFGCGDWLLLRTLTEAKVMLVISEMWIKDIIHFLKRKKKFKSPSACHRYYGIKSHFAILFSCLTSSGCWWLLQFGFFKASQWFTWNQFICVYRLSLKLQQVTLG